MKRQAGLSFESKKGMVAFATPLMSIDANCRAFLVPVDALYRGVQVQDAPLGQVRRDKLDMLSQIPKI
jgi:hypothetical protein